jgi:hypothetical protein
MVTWRGQEIPVSGGQVQIADMPQAMRDSFNYWLAKIRYSPKLGRASSAAYFVDDIADFLAWEIGLAKRLQEAKVCCAECGIRYGSRKPNLDGVTFCQIGPCPICGSEDGVTVDMARDFGDLTIK